MKPVEEKDFHGRVQSVDRAMMLLEVLGEDEEGNRLSDLASRTGLAPSTVHRLLTTLEQRQFIQFDPAVSGISVDRPSLSVPPSRASAILPPRPCRFCAVCEIRAARPSISALPIKARCWW
jgi:hypothetical protein